MTCKYGIIISESYEVGVNLASVFLGYVPFPSHLQNMFLITPFLPLEGFADAHCN